MLDIKRLEAIASRFDVPTPLTLDRYKESGNINHTFLVLSGPSENRREYLLQRINQRVFTRPRGVMASMLASIQAQRTAASLYMEAGDWHTISLIPARDGEEFVEEEDEDGITCWRLMEMIPDCYTYKSLSDVEADSDPLDVARETGRGLATYLRLTEAMDASTLTYPLPGYRDTRLYYNQFLSVLQGNRTLEEAASFLPEDPDFRQSTQEHFLIPSRLSDAEYRARMEDPELQEFITLAREQEKYAMTLLDAMREGSVRTVGIHGDTKIDNFLFCRHTHRVKAVVDLDTIMPHTWLADWGDMVRSLVNVAGEKETDLSKVQVNREVFDAVAEGFLSGIGGACYPSEIALMVDAVQIIALELGVRFLADYLRGDTYFQLAPSDPPELNKTRARVQLTLFRQLRQQEAALRAHIADLSRPLLPGEAIASPLITPDFAPA